MKADKELDIANLNSLLNEATRGPWRIHRGLMADDLWITASEREGYGLRGHKDGDGPICHVSKERRHFKTEKDHFGNPEGPSRSWKTPIKKAAKDAELIVAAVNALPELLRRLKLDADETAWLIEWPADKYGPDRYFAAGEKAPIIDVNSATRFARKADAEAIMRAYTDKGAKVAEHMWCKPAKQKVAA